MIGENEPPADATERHVTRRELCLHLKAMEWRLTVKILLGSITAAGLAHIPVSTYISAVGHLLP